MSLHLPPGAASDNAVRSSRTVTTTVFDMVGALFIGRGGGGDVIVLPMRTVVPSLT